MSEIQFEWDPRKARANLKKHDVSFEEASTAFYDESGLVVGDPDHSQDDERFILLGLTTAVRLVVVVHCFRGRDDTIRIISARKATSSETRQYEAQVRK